MNPQLNSRQLSARYLSYIIGFILSVVTTLIAYICVVNHIWPMQTLVFIVMGLGVLQLIIQLVFFLHIGRGSRLKLITFVFAAIMILIVVVGSIWIMYNLNYNMMHMTPSQMQLYMQHNEGI